MTKGRNNRIAGAVAGSRAFGRSRGFTLLELLVAMVMTAILAISISFAFSEEISTQRAMDTQRAGIDQTQNMERQITRLLQGARLAAVTTTAPAATAATTANPPVTFFQGLSDGGPTELGSDRVTFTTTAPGVPMAAVNDTDDYQDQQTARGPIGGLSEVSIGMTAVGAAGAKSGLFERIQTPSDGDPTQGGNEFVLDDNIAGIGFQFWDGDEWQDVWDTTTGASQLPEAVQVTYTLKDDKLRTQHLFVVPLHTSTVTPAAPAAVASGGA